jgi:uncharacterized lipoprotein YddW (UPF0748 family)
MAAIAKGGFVLPLNKMDERAVALALMSALTTSFGGVILSANAFPATYSRRFRRHWHKDSDFGATMMKKILPALALGFCLSVFGQAQSAIPAPPGMPGELQAILPEGVSAEELSALFRPMAGSLPASWQQPPQQTGYALLPINFVGTSHDRASWDIPIKLDLSGARGVQFDIFCKDGTAIEGTYFYFRSGAGWYTCTFGVQRIGSWCRVIIDKANSKTEGSPAGWGQIDTLRISFWRSGEYDSLAAIANLAVLGSRPEVIVLRAESNIRPNDPESKGYSSYAASLSGSIDALNISCATVSDLDLTAAMLEAPSIVVLPYNPRVPAEVLGLLQDYVARGGKLFVCYSLAGGVAELLGIAKTSWQKAEQGHFMGYSATAARLPGQPDFAPQISPHGNMVEALSSGEVIATWRHADGSESELAAAIASPNGAFVSHVWLNPQDNSKRQFLMAILGKLAPTLWERVARASVANIGNVGPYQDFAAFVADMSTKVGGKVEAQADLAAAQSLRQQAQAASEAGKWQESIALSSQAGERALGAWCRVQPSQVDSFRGFWCHSAFGLAGKNWDESIKFLVEHGFNAIVPNMLWGATSFYPSTVLKPAKNVPDRGDQVDLCLRACAKYGVSCHVWKVNWNCGSHATAEDIAELVKQKRTQKSFSGVENPRWLCPSHPINQQQEIDAMVELVRRYPALDGIHFDYIRFPDHNGCFCDGCRERFQQHIGQVVENWPRDLRQDKALQAQWLQFRRDAIDTVVRQVHEQAKKVRSNIQISAAVFSNWPKNRDEIGQDWSMWCERGWLDFVCPMNYCDSNSEFQNRCRRQAVWAQQVPVYPGIGMSCWAVPGDPVKLSEQINAVRELGLKGFMVFDYDRNALACLPMLKLGTTARPAPTSKR